MEGSSSHGDFLRRYMIPYLLVRAILCCIRCEMRADGMKWHLEIKGPGTWNPETGDLVWLCHTPPSDPCPGLSFPGFQGAQIVLTGLPCAACLGGSPVTVCLRAPSSLESQCSTSVSASAWISYWRDSERH